MIANVWMHRTSAYTNEPCSAESGDSRGHFAENTVSMIETERFMSALILVVVVACLSGCSGRATFEEADAAARSGDYEKAIELFSQLAKTSNDPAVFGNRANCYSYIGDLDAAIADYQTAIDLLPLGMADPNAPMLFYNRGYAYDRGKKYELAIADYEQTIKLQSDYPDVKYNLAWLLATCSDPACRNPERAVELVNQENADASDTPDVLDTAAAAFAAVGDFSRAVSIQEKAVKLSTDQELTKRLNARLDLYREGKAYVETE